MRISRTTVRLAVGAFATLLVTFAALPDASAQRRDRRSAAERADGPHQYDTGDAWGLGDEPVRGPDNANVTIVEFSDFQCPYCSRVQSTLDQIFQDDEFVGDVRLVFMHMPLAFHGEARDAAEASLAAHAQGLFWEYHDVLFRNMRALTAADLEGYAEDVGIMMPQFRADVAGDVYAARVDEHIALAGEIGVSGTPNFMINGRLLTGAQPYDRFAEVIREEQVAMRALISGGLEHGEALAERMRINAAVAQVARTTPQVPAGPDLEARIRVDLSGAPVRGNPDAPVTIVEFSDAQCPSCARADETLATILAEYPDDVRLVYFHLPLAFHADAEPAAYAMIAAQNQGQFWEFHDLIYANQRALSATDLEGYAGQLGLDVAQYRVDIADPSVHAIVAADAARAASLQVRGTPSFFVQGNRLVGAQPAAEFRERIDAALLEAQPLLDAGVAPGDIYDAVLADEPSDVPFIDPAAVAAVEAALAPLDMRWPDDQVPDPPIFPDYEHDGWPSAEGPEAEAEWLVGTWNGRLDVLIRLLAGEDADVLAERFDGAVMQLELTADGEMNITAEIAGSEFSETGTYEVVLVEEDRIAIWTVMDAELAPETELMWVRFRTANAIELGNDSETVPFERADL